MSIDAMKQALITLEWNLPVLEDYGDHEQLNRQHKAISTLRAAIERPQTHSEECWRWHHKCAIAKIEREVGAAMAALRERLAQPEQEPVAWITDGGKGELWWYQSSKFDEEGNLIGDNPDDIPLYTAPPPLQWQGLTDEEIKIIWRDIDGSEGMLMRFARAIEAKLKERNT